MEYTFFLKMEYCCKDGEEKPPEENESNDSLKQYKYKQWFKTSLQISEQAKGWHFAQLLFL